jgi:hypothetical protein
VSMDGKKIAAVQAWPLPRSVKALRGFLGLTGYYRQFMQNYSTIVVPLTVLLKRKHSSGHQRPQQHLTHSRTPSPPGRSSSS